MTLVDLILLALFGAICFVAGYVHAMRVIVKAVIEQAETDQKDTGTDLLPTESQLLNIEKHNNMYYAYVGEQFAGQSSSLQELVINMKHQRKIVSFKVAHIAGLDSSERAALAEAIYNNYQIK